MPDEVGNLSRMHEEVKMKWSIPDFFSLSDKDDNKYKSPSFVFFDECWYISLQNEYEGFIAIYLMKEDNYDPTPMPIICIVSLKTTNKNIFVEKSFSYNFDDSPGYGFPKFIQRSQLITNKATLAPSGVVSFICCLKTYEPSSVLRTEKLSQDFESMLIDKTDADVTIRVQKQEFRLHKSVLGARSPVLAAMFRHDMSEKATGVVSIPDCSADIFSIFTSYLYSGKVKELSADNVFDLFKVADKYQVEELAEDCSEYMASIVTIDTFYEVAEVALSHGNIYYNLMRKVNELLSDNLAEIIRCKKWEKLLVKKPLEVNNLLKKAFPNSKDKN